MWEVHHEMNIEPIPKMYPIYPDNSSQVLDVL
jgi:hypothetical protein